MPIAAIPTISNYYITNITEALASGQFEATFDWIIDKWANLADLLMSGVIPVSTTSSDAKSLFITTMQPLKIGVLGIPLLEAAFMAYATTLAGGMVGAGFIGTPPPSLPLITPITLINQPGEIFATLLEGVLIPWAKTGTATPSSGGSPIIWT